MTVIAEPVEVRQGTPWSRGLSVALLLVAGGFYAWRAYQTSWGGLWFAILLGAGLLWVALWMLRIPDLVVRADESGLTYTDTHLGWLLVFNEERAAWSDVVEVGTRRVSTRYGSYLRTRVKVRAPGGDGTRTITVSSRCQWYEAFLHALRRETEGRGVTVTGFGYLEGGVTSVPRGIGTQRKVMLVTILVLVAVILVLRLIAPR